MGKTVVKLNLSGIRELKNEAGVMAFLHQQAQRVASRVAGHEKVTVSTEHHAVTGVARVHAEGRGAMREEAEHGGLARALGAGGGTGGI